MTVIKIVIRFCNNIESFVIKSINMQGIFILCRVEFPKSVSVTSRLLERWEYPKEMVKFWVLCLGLMASRQNWPHFSNKNNSKIYFIEKCQYQKNVLLNWYFSTQKILRKIKMIFGLENWLWKSNFGTFWQLASTLNLQIW